MAPKWHSTKFQGVRRREHPTRRHGVSLDLYFVIRSQVAGKRREEGLGWASECWSAQKTAAVLADLKRAHTLGEGAQSLAEKRELARLQREAAQAEEAQRIPFEKAAQPLPCAVVDEAIYAAPPTLLIATIDKFARLAWEERTSAFFGRNGDLPPALIIQDELHLISGALGSIAGVYEAAVDTILTCRNVRPKYIASTATIRMATRQIEACTAGRWRYSPRRACPATTPISPASYRLRKSLAGSTLDTWHRI